MPRKLTKQNIKFRKVSKQCKKSKDYKSCMSKRLDGKSKKITNVEKKITSRIFIVPLILISAGILDILTGFIEKILITTKISMGIILLIIGLITSIIMYYYFDKNV